MKSRRYSSKLRRSQVVRPSQPKVTLAGVGSYFGGVATAELVRRNQPRTVWGAVGLLALIGGGAWLAYEAAGQQGLDLFARGIGHQAQT